MDEFCFVFFVFFLPVEEYKTLDHSEIQVQSDFQFSDGAATALCKYCQSAAPVGSQQLGSHQLGPQ